MMPLAVPLNAGKSVTRCQRMWVGDSGMKPLDVYDSCVRQDRRVAWNTN